MASQLIEFLEGRKLKAHGVDWERKKGDWLDAVNLLYEKIAALLGGALNSIVKYEKIPIEVTEELIGTYSTNELRLIVGDDVVTFKPIGTTVIGAAGRVDLQGDRDIIPLIWRPGDEAGDWQFLLQRVPRVVTVPLDEGALAEALQRVMAP